MLKLNCLECWLVKHLYVTMSSAIIIIMDIVNIMDIKFHLFVRHCLLRRLPEFDPGWIRFFFVISRTMRHRCIALRHGDQMFAFLADLWDCASSTAERSSHLDLALDWLWNDYILVLFLCAACEFTCIASFCFVFSKVESLPPPWHCFVRSQLRILTDLGSSV